MVTDGNMIVLTCQWCGERFKRPHQRGTIPKYCSGSHRQRADEQRRIDRQVAREVAKATRPLLREIARLKATLGE